MKPFSTYTSLKKAIFISLIVCAQTLLIAGMHAQSISKGFSVRNNSSEKIVDYTLEVPVENLGLLSGNYIATVEGQDVPVEIVESIHGKQVAVIPISSIDAKKEIRITIKRGSADNYPKRTYAELSHKIGGYFEGHKYLGGYSWVKPNYVQLAGDFRDHSYFIKYEGPGWESDKVAFRFYLDNRNAIDVFGKKTSDIVLPAVGVDGFDNYHKMADWGMDNMKVGKSLGIGSIAIWDGQKAIRVEKKDSMTCFIPADGKVRSQVRTDYYGWEANYIKCDLKLLITIDAGSRASHMELLVSRSTVNELATGIIKSKDAELIVHYDENNTWSYIATFGKQSLNNDMQGLVVFARTKQIIKVAEDDLNHLFILKPENGYVDYYFMPTWELDKEPVATKEAFLKCVNEMLNKLNNPLTIRK